MSGKEIEKKHHKTFDIIKEADDGGMEFWTARKLARVLEYSEYRHFLPVIEKAKKACKNSGHDIKDHFEDVLGMVKIGSSAKRTEVGAKVRQTIKELGGDMPEDLPNPEKSVKQLERGRKKVGCGE